MWEQYSNGIIMAIWCICLSCLGYCYAVEEGTKHAWGTEYRLCIGCLTGPGAEQRSDHPGCVSPIYKLVICKTMSATVWQERALFCRHTLAFGLFIISLKTTVLNINQSFIRLPCSICIDYTHPLSELYLHMGSMVIFVCILIDWWIYLYWLTTPGYTSVRLLID